MASTIISQPRLASWAIIKDESGHFFVARANSLTPISKAYAFVDPYPIEKFSRVKNTNGLWGMVRVDTGEEVIPCEYSVLSVPYPGGHVLAVKPGKDLLDESEWLHLPRIA